MSELTRRKLAEETITTIDALLRSWISAIDRGDVDHTQVSPVTDSLLDVRAAAVTFVPPKRKRVKT